MADEEVKPVEEQPETIQEEVKQEELPLAIEAAEIPEAEPIEAKTEETKPAEQPKTYEQTVDQSTLEWRHQELKAKHRQLQEAKERQAALQAEIDAKNALLAKFNQQTEQPVVTVPAEEVDRRAREIVAQQQYTDNCNKTAQIGEKTYGADWKEAIENLELLGGFDMATMNGVLATDDPAKVLYELGKNPNRYHQIRDLSLEKRIIEMGKIAMQPATKPVSNAPAPVSPVGGRAAPAKETLRDDMDDDTWNRIRLAQKRARWAANNAPRR